MRKLYTCVLGLLGVLVIASTASAQTPTSYQANFYPAGGSTVTASETFAASAAVCNQAPASNLSTVNPTKIDYADIAHAGQICIFSEPSTGPMQALPPGNYEITLIAIDAAGASAESARAPFSRVVIPAVPTGVQAVK